MTDIKMSDMTILCVEHHPEYMGTLKYMLESAGYQVMPATTGTQALRLLTNREFDGVLLDYDLPDATGTSVRAEMKRIRPEVPVLLFSGVGSQTLPASFFRFVSSESRMAREGFRGLRGVTPRGIAY
jgi:CheY-like chemotaxis protein